MNFFGSKPRSETEVDNSRNSNDLNLSNSAFQAPVIDKYKSCFTSKGDALESAMILGVSTKGNYQHFVDDGGLNNSKNNTWCGYSVSKVEVGHDEKTKLLKVFAIYITNQESFYTDESGSFKATKLPSANNLRNDLSNECTREILKEDYSSAETENYFCTVANFGCYSMVRISVTDKKLSKLQSEFQCFLNKVSEFRKERGDSLIKYDLIEKFKKDCASNKS